MKTIVLSIFIASSLISFSQNNDTINLGAKVGYNNSNMSGRDSNGDKNGYLGNEIYVGVFSNFLMNKHFHFQIELIYSYTEDYNFLELPINLNYCLSDKFYLFAGPKFDFILDNDENAFESNYKFRNFGVSADFGIRYYLIDSFFIETRYSVGFVAQLKRDIQLDINNATRNTFRIGLGYVF